MGELSSPREFPGKVSRQEGGIQRYHEQHPPVWWVGTVAANTDVNCSYEASIRSVFTHLGPVSQSPGNLTGPKPYFEIKLSRKIGCFFTSNEVHFVSLADNFTV